MDHVQFDEISVQVWTGPSAVDVDCRLAYVGSVSYLAKENQTRGKSLGRVNLTLLSKSD